MATINSWNNAVANAKSAITLNAGTNQIDIGSDASNNTINLATGGAVKSLTVGSTNTTSSTAIKSGTGNIINNTGLTIDSSGRNYNTKQPAFFSYISSTQSNVTGDSTVYTIPFSSEVFDQNNDFNTGTYTFTAPITGKYDLKVGIRIRDLTTSFTGYTITIKTTARNYEAVVVSPGKVFEASTGTSSFGMTCTVLADMTAGDTSYVTIEVNGSTKTVDVVLTDGTVRTFFSGYLVC